MNNKKKAILIISISLISLIIGVGGYLLFSRNVNSNEKPANLKSDDTSVSIEDVLNNNNEDLLKLEDIRKPVIFAIYGIDDKTTEDGRSDIIMVVKYDPTLKKMLIVSIPRDTRGDIPGYGMNKINAAYAYGQEQLINQVVENLLDIKLDFTIKLNFDTFSNIIDTLGGVKINAKKQFFASDGTLVVDQGSQLLTGEQALFYVRFRSDDEYDYGRIARQQEVVISLIEYLKTSSLSKKIELVMKYYNQGIETDANLTKITDYIKMSSKDTDIIYENHRLQTYGEIIDGLWYELYHQEDLDTIKALFDHKEEMNLDNWRE